MKNLARALVPLFVAAYLSALPAAAQEATLPYAALDNGDFEEAGPSFSDDDGLYRIPWWRSSNGMQQVVRVDDRAALSCSTDEWASQPIPVYEPLLEGLRVSGELRGRGLLEITGGQGTAVRFELESDGDQFTPFEIGGAELIAKLGRRPIPRLDLRLSALDDSSEAVLWRDLQAHVELPLPTEAELRAELLTELEFIFQLWFERGLDREQPVATGFLYSLHDVLTGERVGNLRGGYHSFFSMLQQALASEEVPEWRAAHERYMQSLFKYCISAETGLPHGWNAVSDKPASGKAGELSFPLRVLIDIAENEPEPWRTQALEAATRIGEVVLDRGVQPDGSIDTCYRASDAFTHANTPPIRRLDVPAQLARLGKLTGDERFTRAALRAVRRLEFTHHWSGDWDQIDPAFDDHFGNYAARGIEMWQSHPDEPSLRHVTTTGLDYYLPRWKDAVRLGGYIAADEVRGWMVLLEAAHLDEGYRAQAREHVWPALRAHFKSEQYHNGSWGDVTYYLWDAKVNLKVGDLPAIPQNLLLGLAHCYSDHVDLRTDEVRAMFTAVLRTTTSTYRREFGYLGTLTERNGLNLGGSSIRMLPGLVEMFARLEE